MILVNALEKFGSKLNTVQSPSRYLGGEYGSLIKPHAKNDSLFNVAVAFPDLYEIGMSNMAIKIICNGLNKSENIRAELVFAPDTDFEQLLKETDTPLYTLGTGMPLCSTDVLAFSIGYELGATELLAVLENGKVPLLASERGDCDPIVLAGGCGVTNPAPLSDFVDAFMIGEAEAGLFELIEELALLKKNGASRSEKLELIKSKPFMWTREQLHSKGKVTRRAVQENFGKVEAVPSVFPLPMVKPVQDHGVVEIMRGCPNGCRFCHAGIYYRPSRVKNLKYIIDETDSLVFDAGYREISLNSLSSADFPDIGRLLDILNERYKGYNVSFQLPSLKVNSMSLPVLEKISTVRRSGLTFAVETPDEMWQLSLNKEVYSTHLEEIIREAKAKGWSSAKFYFMVGLPLGDYFTDSSGGDEYEAGLEGSEERAIADFLIDIQSRTRIQCNVNVGVFIPKPHTPYQWVRQIDPKKAEKKIDYIFKRLPRGKFKMGRHNFDATILEGLLSRGDERVGPLILEAFKKGVRLDAWDEHLRQNMPLWDEAFAAAGWDVKGWIFRNWDTEEELPWDGVSLGPAKNFYKREWQKSFEHVLTARCQHSCSHPCGVCNNKVDVYEINSEEFFLGSLQNKTVVRPKVYPESNIPVLYRVVFYFTRAFGGEFTAYLSQVEIFHKAILRSGLPFVYSSGFNPLPRIEFCSAMGLGIPSYEEVASCLLYEDIPQEKVMEVMNSVLPPFFKLTQVMVFPVTTMRKREALSQGVWGGEYRYKFKDAFSRDEFLASQQAAPFVGGESFSSINKSDELNAFTVRLPVSDKKFRAAIEEWSGKKWYEVTDAEKIHTLAKGAIQGWTARDEENWRNDSKNFVKDDTLGGSENEITSFMELYSRIAKVNAELIVKKQALDEHRAEFYKEHPDVLKKHLAEDEAKDRKKNENKN